MALLRQENQKRDPANDQTTQRWDMETVPRA
jgi:hypothetical protein